MVKDAGLKSFLDRLDKLYPIGAYGEKERAEKTVDAVKTLCDETLRSVAMEIAAKVSAELCQAFAAGLCARRQAGAPHGWWFSDDGRDPKETQEAFEAYLRQREAQMMNEAAVEAIFLKQAK